MTSRNNPYGDYSPASSRQTQPNRPPSAGGSSKSSNNPNPNPASVGTPYGDVYHPRQTNNQQQSYQNQMSFQQQQQPRGYPPPGFQNVNSPSPQQGNYGHGGYGPPPPQHMSPQTPSYPPFDPQQQQAPTMSPWAMYGMPNPPQFGVQGPPQQVQQPPPTPIPTPQYPQQPRVPILQHIPQQTVQPKEPKTGKLSFNRVREDMTVIWDGPMEKSAPWLQVKDNGSFVLENGIYTFYISVYNLPTSGSKVLLYYLNDQSRPLACIRPHPEDGMTTISFTRSIEQKEIVLTVHTDASQLPNVVIDTFFTRLD
jgi:hypothetical protein